MPGVNGFMVMNALSRDAGPNRRTPICIVTADSSEAARVCAVRAHACYFLTKPVRVGALLALVSDCLRKSTSAAPPL
jgi:DNA-binding response OmpR family regulator